MSAFAKRAFTRSGYQALANPVWRSRVNPATPFGVYRAQSTSTAASSSPLARPEQLDAKFTKDVPDYMTDIYTWAYVNPTNVKLLDSQLVVDVLLFFNARALERAVLAHLDPGCKAIQVGHTHGGLVPKAAQQVGPQGDFSVVDVTPIQVQHAEEKVKDSPWCKVRLGDACIPEMILPADETPHDVAYAFMILHEVPDYRKYQIVNNMLKSVRKGGTVVWVEYHGPPYWYNPTRYFMPFVFKWLEPFALVLWDREIESFADEELKKQFKWSKEVYGGNLYQVVVAKHIE
jgi:ubiquinone/menaquinone biosynthesis C-methylase UbiE